MHSVSVAIGMNWSNQPANGLPECQPHKTQIQTCLLRFCTLPTFSSPLAPFAFAFEPLPPPDPLAFPPFPEKPLMLPVGGASEPVSRRPLCVRRQRGSPGTYTAISGTIWRGSDVSERAQGAVRCDTPGGDGGEQGRRLSDVVLEEGCQS